MKKYGLKLKRRDPRNYVLGSVFSLPKVILQSDGQWDAYLPEREIQNTLFETSNCTAYGTNAVIETLLNRLNAGIGDRSDRFLGIKAGTKPPGNDPRKVAQAAHENGLVSESTLPYKDLANVKEYYSYKGSEEWKCDVEAQDFLKKYEVGYEDVWKGSISLEEKKRRVKEALQYSPLGIAVSAWHLQDGVYVDKGRENNHWVMAYGYTEQGIKVFDSYDTEKKLISWDHRNSVCIRYHLEKQATQEEIGIFLKMLQAISQWLTSWQKEQNATIATPAPNPPVAAPQPLTEPVGSKLIEWATAIRDYEGKPGDLNYRLNNPGNLRSVKGPFLKFKTWEEGWRALLDYLTRAATGKHKAYRPEFTLLQFFKVYAPSADKNNPVAYATWVAKRIGVPITTQIKNLV